MMSNNNAAVEAKSLLLSEYRGVLSTHSVDMPGFPFGSVSPYCLDSDGLAIILISSIAQHTKNIEKNCKVSLIITEDKVDDIHKAARLTLLSEAEKVAANDDDTRERYYRFFPPAREYHLQHNFEFYRLNTVRARYIGGFGNIHWVSAEELLLSNPFSGAEEDSMIDHMNNDHADAIKKYYVDYNLPLNDEENPVMVGIDCQGCNLRAGSRVSRISFPERAVSAVAVRQQLVTMARA